MQNFNNKLYMLFLSLILIIIFSESAFVMNWENYKLENIKNLKDEISLEKKVIYNYNLSIAYANLGEITKSQNTLDNIKHEYGKEKFKNIIYSYVKNIDYTSKDLLDLNYAAFYYLIDENYPESSKYFRNILNIEPKNVNTFNYLAGNKIMLDKFKEAEKLLIKADNIKSNEFTNLLYGYIYYERGNYIKAFSKFSKTGNLIEEIFLDK